MLRVRGYISIIIIFLFVSVSVSAQRYTVSGKVIDANNNPVEFASVSIVGTVNGTLTDENGTYKLNSHKSDTVEVEFSCIGFEKLTRKLIEPEGEVKLDTRMYRKDRVLDEVSIKSFRKQTSTLERIDAKDLKLMADATGGSVEALIATMPGVHSNNELSTQYSVRGGNYDENLVYINGIEVYRPMTVQSGQQEGLSVINPDMVGAIGFSAGGFAAEYGDKMSSVLDITYKTPERVIEGSASASMLGASIMLGSKVGKFTQMHGLRYKKNTTLLSTLDTKGEYDPTFIDYQTYMTYEINSKWDVSLLGNISHNLYNFTPVERETTYGTYGNSSTFKVYFDGGESDKFQSFFGAFTVNYKPTSNTTISLLSSAYATNEITRYDISGEYWLSALDDDDTSSGTLGYGSTVEHANNQLNAAIYSITLKGKTKVRGNNELTYGVTYQYERVKESIREWETRDSAGYTLPYTGNGIDLVYSISANEDINSDRVSMYVQDTYKFGCDAGDFTLTAGLRGSYWNFNREFIVSPRVSLGYMPAFNSDLTFRLATGIYYQAPSYKEIRDTITDATNNVIVQLNSDIKSQQSIHFILGSDYVFRMGGRPFKLTAEAYYKILNDLIPYEVDNLRIWYRDGNISHGYATGLDLKLFGEFVPGVDSWIGLSLMSSQEYINGIKVPRPTEQRYSLTLFFQDYVPKVERLKFSLKGVLADGLPQSAPGTGREEGWFRTPSYKRVDIGLYCLLAGGDDKVMSRKFFKDLKSIWLGVDVFNLFDMQNVNSYYWVTDIYNQQSAVPNYLTSRQFNVKLTVDF